MSADFLDRLIGDWTYEGRSLPDGDHIRTGIETVARRGAWLVIESDHDARFQLAFDPATGRVVGDFVHWDDPTLWLYDGALEGEHLVLHSRGPRMDGTGDLTDYQDVWEILSPDERRLTGRILERDGRWRDFTVTDYRRKSAP